MQRPARAARTAAAKRLVESPVSESEDSAGSASLVSEGIEAGRSDDDDDDDFAE